MTKQRSTAPHAIGVVCETPLLIKIQQFQDTLGITTEAAAARAIMERYFMLPYKERDALEAKIERRNHSNKGFRKLQCAKGIGKPKAKAYVLSSLPQPPCPADKVTQRTLDV